MSKAFKIILFTVSGGVALLIFAALALLLLVDANAYKTRLAATASETLGMELRVGGRLGFAFFPGLLVTLEDVHLRNQGADVVSAKEARLWLELLPLLHQEVRFGKIALSAPVINIAQDRDGKFNFAKTDARGSLPALDLARLAIADGTLRYANQQSGEVFEAGECNLDVWRLQLASGERADLMQHLAFTAELACGEIRSKDFAASDLKVAIAGKDGVFDLKPFLLSVFGGHGAGTVQANFADVVPHYQVRYALDQFQLEEALKPLSPDKVGAGAMDFSANLSLQGKSLHEMRETMAGQISLRGKNLTLNGSDLDREFARFESSQNFNLVDVGAVFFAGPFGLLVTKGYNFASIFRGSGGHSDIRLLVSDWKVERGVAQAQDVAMATNENRIALKGGLDFVNERFNDVTVALLDAKGCTRVRQKIQGSFQKPVVENPSIFKSLVGPARKLLKQGRELFPGGACEVFYAGSVAPPP